MFEKQVTALTAILKDTDIQSYAGDGFWNIVKAVSLGDAGALLDSANDIKNLVFHIVFNFPVPVNGEEVKELPLENETMLETVCLLSKLYAKQHIEIDLSMDELDLTAAESKATYDEIKAYVLEKHGLKVSSLYISQVKRKCGLDVGQNYNLSKKEDAKVPQCPPEKEAAIMEALKYFQML